MQRKLKHPVWRWISCAMICVCFMTFGPVKFLRAQQKSMDVETLQIRPNFYMIAGAGGNIGVQFGPDGVVLVDSGAVEYSDKVLAAIRKLTTQPIIYIINTGADADHVGGNTILSHAGRNILALGPEPIGGEGTRGMTNNFAATVYATEPTLLRMSTPPEKPPYPSDAWPTETFTEKRRTLFFNHEGLEVLRQPAAHSDGDAIVFFRASDVIVAGDIMDTAHFPMLDLTHGGSIQGEIEALNKIVELAIRPLPFSFNEGGTVVIPGHGRLYDHADSVEYRDMVVIVRDTVQDMMKRGMTLEQIKVASPAKQYEPRYGAKSGPWTTNDFVEAIYNGLSAKK